MDNLWLHREGHPNLIVFCNGWGMDERPFRPLLSDCYDVLMLSDYRTLSPAPDILGLSRAYADIFLISWSMGVWAGQRLFSGQKNCFRERVAINGTLCPIHDDLGIPAEILAATVQNYSAESRQRLYRRMCRDRELCSVFQTNLPARSLESQREELEVLLTMCDCQRTQESIYSHIMIANRDLVMPTANQLRFWKAERPYQFLGHHFPFYLWPSWDALLVEVLPPGIPANPRLHT